jgi:hypothetical protein
MGAILIKGNYNNTYTDNSTSALSPTIIQPPANAGYTWAMSTDPANAITIPTMTESLSPIGRLRLGEHIYDVGAMRSFYNDNDNTISMQYFDGAKWLSVSSS